VATRLIAANFAAHGLAWPVARYITAQRDRLIRTATPLPERWKLSLRTCFDDIDLDRARLVEADPLPISVPPFYSVLKRLRMDFPDPSLVSAITFDNVIASREVMTAKLLFHELVHATQVRLLGIRRFSRLYVRGFLAYGSYDEIPIERCAVELEYRFATGDVPFSVMHEVWRWIDLDLF
jgi:hypothetical protein